VTPLTDPKDLVTHELKDVKARRIILDAVKDHLIPYISEKKSAKDMFVALTNLFQISNTNRKMVLREKLKDTKMTKLYIVTSYLTKITQVRDQLAVVEEVVSNEELERTALNGFSRPWAPFIKAIIAWEKLPDFDRLWDDFIQKEIREESLVGQQVGDDENLALAGKEEQGEYKWRVSSTGWKEQGSKESKMLCVPQEWPLCFTVSEQEEREELASAGSSICRSSSQGVC
jgi:hypothetical protein